MQKVDLLDDDLSAGWLLKYFHRDKLWCLHCGRGMEELRVFRTTKKSRLTVYRRVHATVRHGEKEWARDNDGEGLCAVHANTNEGMWMTMRNFLWPLCGVRKKCLGVYAVMGELGINLKRIAPAFISALVALH